MQDYFKKFSLKLKCRDKYDARESRCGGHFSLGKGEGKWERESGRGRGGEAKILLPEKSSSYLSKLPETLHNNLPQRNRFCPTVGGGGESAALQTPSPICRPMSHLPKN